MKPHFLLLMLVLAACQIAPGAANERAVLAVPAPAITSTVTYAVTQNITLSNEGPQQPAKHNLWVALIGDHAPYQQVLSRTIEPPGHTLVTDEYGNQYAEFDLHDLPPGGRAQVSIRYEIAVHELVYDLGRCLGDLPDVFNQPELHVESANPQIVALATELSASGGTVCEQVRAFYDYIGHNLVYTYNGRNWGAQAALGEMGADCTEYASLLMALSRAQGIPARYVAGLLLLDESGAGAARLEHAWTEIYFPGSGWAPVDPTLGRSSLTREQHFARYTPNHIIVTTGRSPSTLRGASYWSHLYWPGDATTIRIRDAGWTITPLT